MIQICALLKVCVIRPTYLIDSSKNRSSQVDERKQNLKTNINIDMLMHFLYSKHLSFNFFVTKINRLIAQVEVLVQKFLWKYPSRQFLPMKIPRQTNNAYDPRHCLVQIFGAFTCSFKKAYEKTRTDKNAIWYRLWLIPFMKRLRKTEKVYDPDFGPFNLWKDWS